MDQPDTEHPTPSRDWDALFPIQDSALACQFVRETTGDTVILSFSGGKDSLAAWAALRAAGFTRIIPVFHELVPGLECVETHLRHVEETLQTRIVRLPHPFLTWCLREAAFQPPVQAALLATLDYPFRDYDDWADRVRSWLGCPDAWVALGTTRNDSVNRRLTFRQQGCARPAQRKLFPIGDWTKQQIVDAIRELGVKLPPHYRVWGRSFDGTDLFFLEGLRRHWPRDYERVLEWFPLNSLEHRRAEIAAAHRTEARA